MFHDWDDWSDWSDCNERLTTITTTPSLFLCCDGQARCARIMRQVDTDNDEHLSFKELKQALELVQLQVRSWLCC